MLGGDFGVVDESLRKREVVGPDNSGKGVVKFWTVRTVSVTERVLDVAGFASRSSDNELEGGELGGRGSIVIEDVIVVGVKELLKGGVLKSVTRDRKFILKNWDFTGEDDAQGGVVADATKMEGGRGGKSGSSNGDGGDDPGGEVVVDSVEAG